MNEIYLRRKGKLYVKPGDGGATIEHVAVVQKEAEQLGYVLSDLVATRLSSLSVDDLAHFLRDLLKDLRTLTGANRVHEPLYPGFPQQVMRLSEAELYLNAVRHYLTLRRAPSDDTTKVPLLQGRAPRVIDLGTLEDFERMFTRLVGSKTSLSDQDKADVSWYVRQYRGDVFRLLPASIPFKENLAIVGARLLQHVPGETTDTLLREQVRTATDVLRIAVALADGDVSLAKPTKFGSLKRSHRKFLLDLIERTGEPAEDMLRWSERWKRAGEALHPGDFAERFPKAFAAFAMLRSGPRIRTFDSRIETLLREGAADTAARQLESRPGSFARRLDHVVRTAQEPTAAADAFGRVAAKVSTPVLLQVLTHFKRRGENPLRTFFPKGDAAKVFAVEETRPPLAEGLAQRIVTACESALLSRFAALAPLGKCYVDPELRNHLVPFSQRSASKSLRTLVRGSRLPMPDARFIRLFLWWTNGRSRT